VLLTVGVGDVTLQAVRQLTLAVNPPTSIDTNPSVLGVQPFTTSVPAEAGPLASPGALADGGTEDVGVGTSASGDVVLAALVPRAASDPYVPGFAISDDGGDDASDAASTAASVDAGAVYESLQLAWFVQNGVLAQATTALPAARQGDPQGWSSLLVNRWTPPGTPGTSEMILVIRDNRGGVGWVRQMVPNQVVTAGGRP
jgi:hypothetical protein